MLFIFCLVREFLITCVLGKSGSLLALRPEGLMNGKVGANRRILKEPYVEAHPKTLTVTKELIAYRTL
jgi:hypothetical protein